MAFLVVANSHHPLRPKLKGLIAQLGGAVFYFLPAHEAKLTTSLLEYLPDTLQLLFLSPRAITIPPRLREIKDIYPRRAWLALPPDNFTILPTVLGSQITSFLTPVETAQIAPTSKDFRELSQRAFLQQAKPYSDLWESLRVGGTEADKTEFIQSLLTPRGQAAYREYLQIMAQKPEEEWDRELIITSLPPPLVREILLYKYPTLRVDQRVAEELVRLVEITTRISDRQLTQLIRLFKVRPPWGFLIREGRLPVIRQLENMTYVDMTTMRTVTFATDPYLFHGNGRTFFPLTDDEEKFDREFITAAACGVLPIDQLDDLRRRKESWTGRYIYPRLRPDRPPTTEGSFILATLQEMMARGEPIDEFMRLMRDYLRWSPSPEERATLKLR